MIPDLIKILNRNKKKLFSFRNKKFLKSDKSYVSEADLMILIAKDTVKNPDSGEEESPARHLNIVKNKLSGWHGVEHCELDYVTARYQ